MQEHTPTRQRLAALAAFCAFWAALLVTIGFPIWLVVLGYLVLVAGIAAAVEGRQALNAIAPRLSRAGDGLAQTGTTVARRLRSVDVQPLRSRASRAAALAAAARRAAVGTARAHAGRARERIDASRSQQAARKDALALNAKAASLRQEGELDGSLEAAEQALELVRELGDRRAEALTLNGIGLTQARLGDEAGAVDSYETAVAILTELGDGHGAGRVLANLGALHLDLGREDEARARWVDALERLEPGSPEHARTAEQLRLAS